MITLFRYLTLIVLGSLFGVAWPGAAFAEDPLSISRQATYRVIDVRSDDVLNMRNGPAPSAAKVGEIPYNGRDIHTTGRFTNYESRRWAEVIYGRTVGWVSTRYLTYEEYVEPPGRMELYRDYGLSARIAGASQNPPTYPVSCGEWSYPYGNDFRGWEEEGDFPRQRFQADMRSRYELSMSRAFFQHFQRRGFSRETLCLGLGTPMGVDITTGFSAPSTSIEDPFDNFNYVMLNLPDCFAGGTPLLDCEYNFDMIWGDFLFYPEMAQDARQLGLEIDQAIRGLIASGQVSDGEIIGHDRAAYLLGEDTVYGWFVSAIVEDLQYIVISEDLPRGYGYRIHTARVMGDDSEADEETGSAIAAKSFSATDASFSVPWKVQASIQTGN